MSRVLRISGFLNIRNDRAIIKNQLKIGVTFISKFVQLRYVTGKYPTQKYI